MPDTPAETSDTPAEASDTPAEASDTPAEASDTPAEASDTPAEASDTPAEASRRLHELVAILRRECPWDREQTHASLAPYAIEEANELAVAATQYQEHQPTGTEQTGTEQTDTAEPTGIADSSGAEQGLTDDLVEELGDLLLQVYMHAAIAEQSGTFALTDIFQTVEKKMIRRHPHVFDRSSNQSSDRSSSQSEPAAGMDPETASKTSPEMTMEQLAEQWERIKAEERSKKNR